MNDPVRGDEFRYPIGNDEQLSTAIVLATSALTGQPIHELPPLDTAVPADAVDVLYDSMKTRGTARGRFLSVSYCGVTVEVGGDRTLYLHDDQISE